MTTIVGIMLGGIALAGAAAIVLDYIADKYEARTGRDWQTGEPK